ncbi:unnamed protein product [Dovyalis caffra]|uniref:AP2/ERF transcription factor n=1 Tax=Dovyalis caffra TaxID=77055 RepID=A0AAV1RRA1_9ROSI|nr:unnamed protein product [Dovyalis caffra]
MEEEASSSMVSNARKPIIVVETSDSNSCQHDRVFRRSKKRGRHDSNGNVARLKGIVQQQNGHWGAQIYANHQRIWIGTFNTEKEAAMAYDSMAIRLRSTDLHRNFPWTDRNIQEPNFQNQYSTEAILNMIRDGSYQQNFEDFLRKQTQREEIGGSGDGLNGRMVHGDEQFSCIRLFQKELTPSDVGKLNRVVIPKKFAVKYLPYILKNVEGDGAPLNAGVEDTELIFYDRLMKSWKFRYCYWRSSQSFVFTKGWNRFVKEKKLKEKDIITFYTCACTNYKAQEHAQDQKFSLIDIIYYNEQSGKLDGVNQIEDMRRELEVSLRQNMRSKVQKDGKGLKEEKGLSKLESKNKVKEKELRLFGVSIK